MQQDISQTVSGKPKKLGFPKQKKVVSLFNNLFRSGFNLTEIVDFLRRSQLLPNRYTDVMQEGLMAGRPFSGIIRRLGFSDNVVTQLSLAEEHGNLPLCLDKIEDHLSQVIQVRKKMIEVATYPLMLLGFLVLIMLGLKNYLLPQLSAKNGATQLIAVFPTVFFILLILVLLAGLGFKVWMARTPHLKVFSRLVKLPLVGPSIRTYLTAYYAGEWGNLIGQGLEMSQILDLMTRQPSRLFSELGHDMLLALSNGRDFNAKVQDYAFFEKELSLIIAYGEAKSKLGQELEIYAKDCWERFFTRVNRLMQLVQPLVFIFVALVVVLIYAAMLLPIYANMEVHL